MITFQKSTPQSELDRRIDRFQTQQQEHRLDGTLILQKADMFYYAGTTQQGWLYMPALGKPLLMVFKDVERARMETGIDQVVSLVSPKKIPEMLAEYGLEQPKRLGLEMDVLTANHYLAFQQIFPQTEIRDVSGIIRMQRAVKSAYEIGKIRDASAMADKVAAKVPDILAAGQTELAFAGMLEAYARGLGHQGLIRMRMWDNNLFYGHIMAGAAAAVPSSFASPTGGAGVNASIAQGPGFNRIGENEPVLVDYVFVLDGYISDHTRIFSIGPVPDDLKEAHEAMLEIQDRVKTAALPGAVTGDLYRLMMSTAQSLGHADCFMGTGDRRIRFTGHGVGLELDEFPFIAQGQELVLENGMVLALEPKVVMPGKGVVGIENTLLVTENGLEPLTLFDDGITVLSPTSEL